MSPANDRSSGSMRLLFGQFQPFFIYAGLFSFCINLLLLVPSLYMLQVFDRVISSRSHETLVMLTLATGGALAIMAVLDVLRHGTIGRGLNDYDAIFSELRSVGFDSWISIEDGVDGFDQLQRSADFLVRKIAQYWP